MHSNNTRQQSSRSSRDSGRRTNSTAPQNYSPPTTVHSQLKAMDFGNPASMWIFMTPTDGSLSSQHISSNLSAPSRVEEEGAEHIDDSDEISDIDDDNAPYWSAASTEFSADDVQKILSEREETNNRMIATRDLRAIWTRRQPGEDVLSSADSHDSDNEDTESLHPAFTDLARRVKKAHASVIDAMAWIQSLPSPRMNNPSQNNLLSSMQNHVEDADTQLGNAEQELERQLQESEAAMEVRWNESIARIRRLDREREVAEEARRRHEVAVREALTLEAARSIGEDLAVYLEIPAEAVRRAALSRQRIQIGVTKLSHMVEVRRRVQPIRDDSGFSYEGRIDGPGIRTPEIQTAATGIRQMVENRRHAQPMRDDAGFTYRPGIQVTAILEQRRQDAAGQPGVMVAAEDQWRPVEFPIEARNHSAARNVPDADGSRVPRSVQISPARRAAREERIRERNRRRAYNEVVLRRTIYGYVPGSAEDIAFQEEDAYQEARNTRIERGEIPDDDEVSDDEEADQREADQRESERRRQDDYDQWEDLVDEEEPWIEGPPPYEHPPVYETLAPSYSEPVARNIVFKKQCDGKAYENITRMLVGRILHGSIRWEDDEPLFDDWDRIMEILPMRVRSW